MNGYKYRCVVSGTCTPDQTSDGTATLMINAPLAFNPILGITTPTKGLSNVPYRVTVDNSPGATYLWSYTGSDAVLSSYSGFSITINFGNSASSGTLTVVETISICSDTNSIVINPQ
jgi:hypothetical protein